jgi:hypothetical protein
VTFAVDGPKFSNLSTFDRFGVVSTKVSSAMGRAQWRVQVHFLSAGFWGVAILSDNLWASAVYVNVAKAAPSVPADAVVNAGRAFSSRKALMNGVRAGAAAPLPAWRGQPGIDFARGGPSNRGGGGGGGGPTTPATQQALWWAQQQGGIAGMNFEDFFQGIGMPGQGFVPPPG